MSFFRALRLILTLHCQESEALISRSFDEELPLAERWAVRLHFISCRVCRQFRKQLSVVHEAAGRRGHLDASVSPHDELPAATRERIESVLRNTEAGD